MAKAVGNLGYFDAHYWAWVNCEATLLMPDHPNLRRKYEESRHKWREANNINQSITVKGATFKFPPERHTHGT